MNTSCSTAYDKDSSFSYDDLRFYSPYGKLFNQLEMEQYDVAASLLKTGSRVLEVGCGTGRFTKKSADYDHNVFAIEPSPYMITMAKKKVSEFNSVNFILSEGAFIPLPDDNFHFVYTIRVVNQLSSEKYALEMVKEMIRVCQPGGIILIEFVNKWGWSRISNCVKISVKDIDTLLEQYAALKVVHVGGVFFLPGRIIRIIPKPFLNYIGKIDSALARLFPQLCTRCYVTIRKHNA